MAQIKVDGITGMQQQFGKAGKKSPAVSIITKQIATIRRVEANREYRGGWLLACGVDSRQNS
ncbi:MAG: hypothetical protein U9R69_12190 [Thermodesulfobacteriota bacterium]|nr:hypothetical protein [Thermodesulfobacteriota bacterium]